MECPRCGGWSADAARCSECGFELGNPGCPVCGSANDELANFCSNCGQSLRFSSVPPPPVAQPPRRDEMFERALRAHTAVDGELRQVTVMFADVRDSYHIVRDEDPEEVAALLDSVVQVMTEAVHRYEGVVNQVLGDGLMALFGAPVAQEDHAVRAACAAMAMQKAVAAMQHPSWQERGLKPQIRIGLNSGDVVLRAIRTDLSIDYRAVGSTIHMASRMEQLAAAGSTLITAHTKRLGGKWIRTRALGRRVIKGLSEPAEVFELLGTSLRTRFQADEQRELSVLAGRSELLHELSHVLESALAGEQRAIVLTGEPGVGKSRLCYELLQLGVTRGARVLEASAPSYGRGTPHGMLANLARALFSVEDSDPPEVVAEKARGTLTDAAVSGDERAAFALEVFELSQPDSPWQALDPKQRRHDIEAMLRQLLETWCARGPAILVFEDVHWCDSESLAFLLALLPHAPSTQRLIIFTHRSDHPIPWPQLPSVVMRQLSNLPPEEAEAMLRRLLGESEELMPVRRLLVERAGGNPFFLEESAQSLIDGGVLFGTPGSYQLRGAFENLQLPETVDALISARVDRLPVSTLQALEALAVAGDEIPANLLCHVLNLPESVLEERLWLLLQAELVFRVNDDASPVYRLKHALIRDVVYRRLVRARRKALHMRVMHAIEHVYKVRLAEHVEQLAEHANRAELWEKSIAYHQMACQRALRRWANTQALAHIERSLAMVKYLPEGDPRDRVALDLRLLALAPVVPSGDHERVIALLLEAEELADKLKDRRRSAAVASQLAFGCWMLGQYDRAVPYARKVIDFTANIDKEIGLRESAYYNLAMTYHAQGKLDAALEILRPQRERFSGDAAGRQMRAWAGYPAVYIRTFMISALSLLGGFEEAAHAYEEGRSVADAFDHPHSRTMIMEEYGYCLWIRGEYAAARELLTAALEVSERDDVLVMHTPIVARLGVAMVHAGELDAGLALLTHELEHKTYRHAAHYGLVFLLIALSEAKLIAGDVAAALAHAEHAMRVTAEAGEQAYRVCALLQLAAASEAEPRRAAEARALYEECEREAERLHMKPWQAFALQHSARSLADRARAREQLQRALAIWNELDAPARVAEVSAALHHKQPSL